MPHWNMEFYSQGLDQFPWFPLLVPVTIWSMFWKGIALYRAARNQQKVWFIGLLIIDTAGILEILYLLFSSSRIKAEMSVK